MHSIFFHYCTVHLYLCIDFPKGLHAYDCVNITVKASNNTCRSNECICNWRLYPFYPLTQLWQKTLSQSVFNASQSTLIEFIFINLFPLGSIKYLSPSLKSSKVDCHCNETNRKDNVLVTYDCCDRNYWKINKWTFLKYLFVMPAFNTGGQKITCLKADYVLVLLCWSAHPYTGSAVAAVEWMMKLMYWCDQKKRQTDWTVRAEKKQKLNTAGATLPTETHTLSLYSSFATEPQQSLKSITLETQQ